MAQLTWTITPEEVAVRIQSRSERLLDRAEGIVRESVAEAAILQGQTLEEAVTKTGRARAASGGSTSRYGSVSPGRIDSGLMINLINQHVEREGNTVVGTWGWDDPEDYFFAQDWGAGRLPAAHSLLKSAREIGRRFLGRVRGAMR